MKSLGNYVYILYGNMHVRSKVYQEFCHAIVYIAVVNGRRHIRIV